MSPPISPLRFLLPEFVRPQGSPFEGTPQRKRGSFAPFIRLEPRITSEPQGSLWTRLFGALRTAGGVSETLIGGVIGVGAGYTGVGAVGGGALALHGIDTTSAGLREIYTGTPARTLTSRSIGELLGSDTAGEIADAGIGFFGSFAGAFSRMARGFRSLFVPAAREAELFQFGRLPDGVLGATDALGNITIQNGLTGKVFQETLDHEFVHRILSPADGSFADLRAQIRMAGYQNSELLRFTEEAIAETYATGNLSQGILHPLENGYDITVKGLATEASVLGGVAANGAVFGASLSAEADE